MIATYLGKRQALDADPKAIQQINFTGSLRGNGNRLLFFIIEEVKETILYFSRGTVKVLCMSSYKLARIAKVYNRKVFDCNACSTILFCFNKISKYNDSI